MIDTLIMIISSPITWALIGIAVKSYCPAAIPWLGAGKKLTDELIELHDNRKTRNPTIIADAHKAGLKKAAVMLERKLG